MKKSLLIIACASLIFSACQSVDSRTQNYAKAMAESTCLLFQGSLSSTEIEFQTQEIFERYGAADSAEIQEYLDEIAGTEVRNQMTVLVREHLEKTCQNSLEANGLTAAEMAEAIVME